jgi:hypothetical protein
MAIGGKLTNCRTISHLAAVFVIGSLLPVFVILTSHLLLQHRNYTRSVMNFPLQQETWRGGAGAAASVVRLSLHALGWLRPGPLPRAGCVIL